MIKEDRAIKILYSYLPKDEPMNAEDREAFFIAIEALKQEPILDKIKSEVEQMDFDFGDFYDHTNTIREMVLEVIDKYRGEEDEDSN